MLSKKEGNKYIVIGIILLFVILSILIFKPFISTLLLAAILVAAFYPLHKRLAKAIRSKSASSAIMTCAIIIVILAPLLFILYATFQEITLLFQAGNITSWANMISTYMGQSTISNYVPQIASEGVKILTNIASSMILSIPSLMINFFILTFSLFSFLLTGESIMNKIKKMVPLKDKEKIFKSLKSTMDALIYGYFVIGIICFIVAAITLSLLGIQAAFLWALFIGILVLIPSIGATIIYIPMTIIFAVQGNYVAAIVVFIMGAIITIIETFGRPYLIGKKAKINPLLVFFGILGGIVVFGAAGIFIGPVVLTTTITILEGLSKK